MNLDTRVKRQDEPLSSHVDDELVIFSARKGMYYGTQAVGKRIWSLIEQETTIAEIRDQLLEEFDIDRNTCERELLAFLGQLQQEDLIRVS
ncbi:PqqD family protein [Halomonas campisalis]|uniref:PqqD family protein n=1 Tax=Billgrantia campisalis TaxID=74661 RepID=A0ABS9P5F8_9GAMM|nr:PqqD family peptide modification chaperone [Halomonas campisalis]MCG6656325.1 PqqD family protein [Halomonas campisalis]MDR5861511.1 PqqD family peptide modification chaperone [Halomonas campisalis]